MLQDDNNLLRGDVIKLVEQLVASLLAPLTLLQDVNNLLRADDIRLVGTTCCKFVDLQTCQHLEANSASIYCWQTRRFYVWKRSISQPGTHLWNKKSGFVRAFEPQTF